MTFFSDSLRSCVAWNPDPRSATSQRPIWPRSALNLDVIVEIARYNNVGLLVIAFGRAQTLVALDRIGGNGQGGVQCARGASAEAVQRWSASEGSSRS